MSGYYESGEFHPEDSGGTGLPGSAVFFHGWMYYFNVGSDGLVYVASCDRANGDVVNGWSNMELPEDAIGMEVATEMPPVAVVSGDAVYLFWFDSDLGGLRVARATWDPSQEASLSWSSASSVQLTHSSAAATPLGGSSSPARPFSACALGGTRIVVAELGVLSTNTYVPWYLALETTSFAPGQPWTTTIGGNSAVTPYETMVGAAKGTLQFLFEPWSVTWYSAGGDVGTDDHSDNTLMLSCAVAVSGVTKYVVFALELSGESVPLLWPNNYGTNTGYVLADALGGASVARDPGGRVRVFYQTSPDSPHLVAALFDTSGAVPVLGTAASINGFWAATDTIPVATYGYSDPIDNGNARVVREWVFYTAYDDGSNPDILCQVAEYGTLRRVVDAEDLDLTAISQQFQPDGVRAITGYIDGPMPVPQVNVGADPSKATGTVTYGWSKQQGISNSISQHMTIGVKTEGKASLGAGAAWEIAMSGGVGSSFGDATVTTSSTRQTQILAVEQGVVSPRGTLFAGGLVVHRDAYTFTPIEASGPAEDAPIFTTMSTEIVGRVARSYDVATVVPGDLESYKPDAWNQRMKDAGFGDDYLETWIYPNAADLDADGRTQKGLPFSWSDSGNVVSTFGTTTSSFEETSWTFETSVYAGASFSFFGIAEATFMAGWTFDMQTSSTTSSGDSWGIDVGFTVPSATTTPGSCLAYDFQLYFLPANRQWATEFFTLCTDEALKATLDPNCACWKIVYVVTSALYNAPVDDLAGHGLAAPLVAALKEKGIGFTGQLLQRYGVKRRPEIQLALRRSGVRDSDRALLEALDRWVAATEWRAPAHHRRPRR